MRLLLLHAIDFHNGQHIFPHPKAYIKPGEGQPIDPVRLSLIGRPWIVGKDADGGAPLLHWQLFQQGRWEVHL